MVSKRKQTNRQLVSDLLNHYGRNDHDGIINLVTEECEFKIGVGASQGIVPYHGTHTGHDEIRGYLAKRASNSMRNACTIRSPKSSSTPSHSPVGPTGRHTPDDLIAHGDVVIAIGHLTDHFSDGKPMHDSDFVIVVQIDENKNKVRKFHFFVDTAAVAEAWVKRHRRERNTEAPQT
jgi:ketosteroid isomerase-like protein